MVGHKSFVAGVLGACLLYGGVMTTSVSAAESAAAVRQSAGEIVWLDTQLGRLQLNTATSPGTRATAQYTITQQDTRVIDRLDKQFLTITDLRAGQQVRIESKDHGQDRIATKITVEPTSAPLFRTAEGTIESIDAGTPGAFTLKETTSPGGGSAVSAFAFDPQTLIVMESPSLQPVRVEVLPGDFVKVEYVVKDGARHARSMMRYSAIPAPASTTTVTTTSTTTTTQ